MNWQDIKTSKDNSRFLYNGNPVFRKKFIEVLKFHAPGIAPVKDESGSYHIDSSGKALYSERYSRTFGYYCNRATVIQNERWFHLNEKGEKAHSKYFGWAGNYQEYLCSVRDKNNKYFHVDLKGEKIYSDTFNYAGDFKDEIACVKTSKGFYRHIDTKGKFLNQIDFFDLGVFHKNIATAKDKAGWHHINKKGKELYKQRFASLEPFYNGFALATQFDNSKIIIDEAGTEIMPV